MRVTVAAASLFALSTAVLACTVETKSSQPAPASDGGVTGSGDGGSKTGVKLPSSGGSKGAKDAGAEPAEPTGSPATCKDAVGCLGECPDDDDACAEGCYADLPAAEMTELQELATCIQNSECDTDECVADVCATPISQCLGN